MDSSVLRYVVDESPDPVMVVDSEGEVTYANRAIGELLGLAPNAMLGARANSLFSGWTDASSLLRSAADGSSLDLTGRLANGEEIPLSCSVRAVDDGGTQFAAFLRERDSLRVENVIDALPDVFYAFDADSTLLEWNDRLSAVTGYDDAELASMTPLDFVPRDDREMIADAIEDVLGGERIETRRSALVTKAGKRIPYEFNASRLADAEENAVGFVGTGRNVVEREAAERELRESERIRSTLVSNLPGIAYRCANEPNRPMTFVSEGCRDLTGYDPDRLASGAVSWDDLIHPDDRERVGAEVQDALADGESFELTYRIRSADGETRWVWEQGRGVSEDALSAGEDADGADGTDGKTPRANDLAALEGLITDVTDRRKAKQALRREKEQLRSLVQGVEEYAIFMLDPEGNVRSWNAGAEQMKGYEREEIVGDHFSAFYTEEDAARDVPERNLADAVERGSAEDEGWRVRADGSLFWANVVITALRTEDGSLRGFAKVTRDLTERREHERKLARQRDELATLNRINVVIHELVRALVSAASREDVEETVCTRLAETNLYQFALVAERDLNGRVVARTRTGDDAGFHEIVASAVDEAGWERPATVALRDGECRVVRDIPEDETVPESVRSAARERGIRSGIAVPLVYGGTNYGVLVVYATRPDAFSEREAAGFDVLGETSGFAINAIERKKLLAADSVVELTFRVTGPNALLADLSQRADCTLALEGTISTSDGAYLYYVQVTDAPPERIVELVADVPDVGGCRLVSSHGDEGVVALTVSSSLVEALTDAGANVLSTRAERGEERVVVEVPHDADVRSFASTFRLHNPDADLVAKREIERPIRTASEFRGQLKEGLTTRQQAALRSAHLAGYFDWPRASTAEAVADSMGISSATFHQHLRKAQGKLAAAFFDDASN
ncbi:PAS domain S-box protein [Haladaptatus salinisoli]|uniref:PAS domain S-box protein n=1 Tax=Haladaptatus salinisoli TaxID=2884876 RepID=UPI001D09D1C1|nr:PAS domain S-box protein [Haladaptatus salinisoli]